MVFDQLLNNYPCQVQQVIVFVYGHGSSISSFASMVVNTCDYTRFACRPIYWPQLLTISIGFSLTSFIGLIVH